MLSSLRGLTACLAVAALLPAAAQAAPAGVTEYSSGLSAGARPDAIAAGPDGNLWFSERGAARIGRITPSGQITEFSAGLAPDAQVNGLTAGPDGNVWFTEEGRVVGRITPAGEITEYAAPAGGLPRGIASGPDGQLWIGLGPGGQIGHLGVDGSGAASFGGLTSGASADDIVAGPDGNLWVTEFSGSRIARVSPGGQVAEFPVGPLSGPRSIAVGPDGALWFTVQKANAVGRVTTDGQMQTFTGGLAGGAGPVDLTAGPDGNLWVTVVTKYLGSRIARVTPAGEITELLLDDGVDAAGIATGPDG